MKFNRIHCIGYANFVVVFYGLNSLCVHKNRLNIESIVFFVVFDVFVFFLFVLPIGRNFVTASLCYIYAQSTVRNFGFLLSVFLVFFPLK